MLLKFKALSVNYLLWLKDQRMINEKSSGEFEEKNVKKNVKKKQSNVQMKEGVSAMTSEKNWQPTRYALIDRLVDSLSCTHKCVLSAPSVT